MSLMGLTLTGSIQPTEEALLRISSTTLFSWRFVYHVYISVQIPLLLFPQYGLNNFLPNIAKTTLVKLVSNFWATINSCGVPTAP